MLMNISRAFAYRFGVMTLISALILLISLLRFADVQSRAMLEHDEGITLLGVTGHQGEFNELGVQHILNKWQPASVWQHYVSLPAQVSLTQVQRDLNLHDIHPPLYFWALSAFLQGYGSVDKVAYLLNWLFAVVAILLFYPLLRQRYDRRISCMLLAVFACTPALAGPFAVLRQYELMLMAGTGSLLAMSVYLQADSLQKSKKRFALAGFTFFAYIGLMTHAQFLLVIAGITGSVLLLPLLLQRKIAVLSAVIVAAGLFFLTNRDFFYSVARLQRQSQEAGLHEFLLRLRSIVNSMDELVGLYPVPAFLVFAGLFGWGLLQSWLAFSGRNEHKVDDTQYKFWLWSSVLVIGLVFLQYLSMNSPRHAIGGRYFLAILPFFTLLIALWLERRVLLKQSWLIAMLLLGTAVNLLVVEKVARANQEQRIAQALKNAKSVLINNPARGVLSPILPSLPASGQVLVTNELISDDNFLRLADRLVTGDVIWLQAGHNISEQHTQVQKRRLAQYFQLEEIGESSGVLKVVQRLAPTVNGRSSP